MALIHCPGPTIPSGVGLIRCRWSCLVREVTEQRGICIRDRLRPKFSSASHLNPFQARFLQTEPVGAARARYSSSIRRVCPRLWRGKLCTTLSTPLLYAGKGKRAPAPRKLETRYSIGKSGVSSEGTKNKASKRPQNQVTVFSTPWFIRRAE